MLPLENYAPAKDPLRILHQDADLLVIDKPSGLLSVPGKAREHADCVESRLRAVFPETLLVHRLDMDTSGVMVFAANAHAQRHLGLQFEKRQLSKTYEALVWGRPEANTGLANAPMIVDWPNRPLQKVCHDTGKSAETEWQVLARGEDHSRMRLRPKTGRSHQLRVHMAHLGHPILGDRFYARGPALAARSRLCLHASEISLRHPNGGDWITFCSDVPF